MRKHFLTILLVIAAMAAVQMPASAQGKSPAKLERVNGVLRLVQDGKPFLMLSGECLNSSSSTRKTMESSFKCAKQMGMNSILASISWEQVEPVEGKFDFSQIDNILEFANKYDLKVAMIWFATWKNGESSYPPLWVKADVDKYFRTKDSKGMNTTTISPVCTAAMKADAKAFREAMKYLRDHDKNYRVVAIQVNNEVGSFVDIDHSKQGLKAYEGKVPSELTAYLASHKLGGIVEPTWNENGRKMSGTWKQVFGDGDYGKQIFMTWSFASYLNEIAKAGKEEYNIPMFANCWMGGPDANHANYPNGGPRQCVIDIYKAAAPCLDWVSPDMYNINFESVFGDYTREDNPLFIPEISTGSTPPAYLAFGEYNAQCYAPFGFEQVHNNKQFVGEYETLGEILPLISEYQGTGKMHGFIRTRNDPEDKVFEFKLGKYNFHVKSIKGERSTHGLAIQIGEDEFIVAGVGGYIEFSIDKPGMVTKVGYAEEIEFEENGNESTLFVLNGDESLCDNHLYMRGRTINKTLDEDGMYVEGPIWRPSSLVMTSRGTLERFKYSGIYKIKLYSYKAD